MTLVRFDPFRELQNIESTMNRFWGDTLSRFFGEPARTDHVGSWSPAVDVYETEGELVFQCELPGFEQEQINISVKDGRLTIRGERKFPEDRKNNYHHGERWYGDFYRTWVLPVSVNYDGISASLKKGVLTVTLPKQEEAKPKQIAVSVQ